MHIYFIERVDPLKDLIFRVAAIIQSRKRKKRSPDWCRNQMERVKELFTFSIATRRLLGIPLVFLVFYYILQINYQFDDAMHILCPSSKFVQLVRPTEAPAVPMAPLTRGGNSSSTESPAKRNASSCRKFAKMSLENLNANYGTITKLITFLLGFYVSNIINRWWNKVI